MYKVADNSNGEQQVWPTSLGIDQAGNVLVAWSDNHHSFVSRSTDGGVTWSAAKQVDAAGGTSVYPTIAGGAAGEEEVAYYRTAVTGDTNDAARMGAPGNPGSAAWNLYWAKSTDSGATFNTVHGVRHRGRALAFGRAAGYRWRRRDAEHLARRPDQRRPPGGHAARGRPAGGRAAPRPPLTRVGSRA